MVRIKKCIVTHTDIQPLNYRLKTFELTQETLVGNIGDRIEILYTPNECNFYTYNDVTGVVHFVSIEDLAEVEAFYKKYSKQIIPL